MKRKSAHDLIINGNLRCLKIVPGDKTKIEELNDLQTVALKLSQDQAFELGIALLLASQQWEEVDLTAFRFKKRRKDDTYQVTVTSIKPINRTLF